MSYFGFLLLFLVIPILVLLGIAWRDGRQGRERARSFRGWPVWSGIALHVAVAVLYTTPWDNYLVATRVWWYDPALVTGLTIGWVPIEEYTFFILQPILAGLWLWYLLRWQNLGQAPLRPSLRLWLTLSLGVVWIGSAALLAFGQQAGTYLALELVWALPPIGLQLAFGADILWRHRRLLFFTIVPVTTFLSAADALAIRAGTWTINPEKSLDFLVGGVLPLEEILFFLLTNTLVTFGLVLFWAEASHLRLLALKRFLRSNRVFRPYAEPEKLSPGLGSNEEIQVQK